MIKDLEPNYTHKARLLHTIDGDTMWFECKQSFFNKTDIEIRLHRVDTPEKGELGYEESIKFVEEKCKDKELRVITFKVKSRQAALGEQTKRGKYRRFIGEVYYPSEDGWINLNDELVKAGLAKY